VLSNSRFIENDRQLALQMGAEIITMMTIIGSILACLIVAFTSYSLMSRKTRELAIAKALGFRAEQIYMAAICQGLVISILGILFTMLLAYAMLMVIPVLAPQINLAIQFQQFATIAAAGIPLAVAASLVVARNLARTDPLLVFNS